MTCYGNFIWRLTDSAVSVKKGAHEAPHVVIAIGSARFAFPQIMLNLFPGMSAVPFVLE